MLPAPVVAMMNGANGVSDFINGISGTSTPPTAGETYNDPIGIGSMSDGSSVDVQNSLLQITQQRTNLEMQVISARQTQINLELQLLAAYQSIAQSGTSPSPSAGSFEGMLNRSYQTRGRYGSGGFRRETP